jgi:hypothetical protein
MDLREMVCNGMELTDLAQDRDQRRVLVKSISKRLPCRTFPVLPKRRR